MDAMELRIFGLNGQELKLSVSGELLGCEVLGLVTWWLLGNHFLHVCLSVVWWLKSNHLTANILSLVGNNSNIRQHVTFYIVGFLRCCELMVV